MRSKSSFIDLENGWPRASIRMSSVFEKDVGEPMGPGDESSPGVFTRQYSKASVEYDCNKHAGSVKVN